MKELVPAALNHEVSLQRIILRVVARMATKRSINTLGIILLDSKNHISNNYNRGAFSKVYRCVSETDGLEYAMKIINKKKQGMKYHFNLKRPYNFVDNEVAILKKMV